MTLVKQWRNGKRNPFRLAHRPAFGRRCAAVSRLRPEMLFWGHRARPIHRLIFLVRRILKFHESDPLLNSTAHGPHITQGR
jgi:hypothetical protein